MGIAEPGLPGSSPSQFHLDAAVPEGRWQAERDGTSIALRAAASLFGGGADTSVSVISSFYLAMALHPDAQRRGQAEIDGLTEGRRLPTLSDRPSLPYVDAIMREVMRWKPPTHMSVPHLSTEEEAYGNYVIPKGTIVMPNVWKMLHDPATFPAPEVFNPGRFLDDPIAVKACSAIFGFGRRACPGVYFAESSMFIAIATSLATCHIANAVDMDGRPISKDVQYTPGTISHPPPFQCEITYRSPHARELLTNAGADL